MKGFTLFELIVVIAIMGIVSGVVFVGVRSGERSLLLDRAANALAQDVRLAMDYSLRARPFGGDCASVGGPNGGGNPNSNWKAIFVAYTILFEENMSEYSIKGLCRIENPSGNSNWRRLVDLDPPQSIQLEDGVRITDIDVNPDVRINFSPPFPTVEITKDEDQNPGSYSAVTITLELASDPSKTRTVKVTNKGVIEVQ